MKALSVRSIEAKTHPQTKNLFWFLFVRTRGAANRIKIVSLLRDNPSNKNQLSVDLDLDYKGVELHLNTLEKNNIVNKVGSKYGATYFVSPLFEEGEAAFDEIVTKLMKRGGSVE